MNELSIPLRLLSGAHNAIHSLHDQIQFLFLTFFRLSNFRNFDLKRLLNSDTKGRRAMHIELPVF